MRNKLRFVEFLLVVEVAELIVQTKPHYAVAILEMLIFTLLLGLIKFYVRGDYIG